MTSPSPITAPGSTSPTGPAGSSASSIRSTCGPWPGSASASTPIRSPSIPRTIGSSSPVRRAIASRSSTPCAGSSWKRSTRPCSPGLPRGARPMPWRSPRMAGRSTSPTPTTMALPSSMSPHLAAARSRASSRPAGIQPPWRSRRTANPSWSGSARGTRPRPTRSSRPRSRPNTTRSPSVGSCRSLTSAPRSQDRYRSSRSPTTRPWPSTPRRSTRIAPIRIE